MYKTAKQIIGAIYSAFDNAKKSIQQPKQRENEGEKIISSEAHADSVNTTKNPNSTNPSQQQLSKLTAYYEAGRLRDAEKLASSITQIFPGHQFAWKILSLIFQHTDRPSDSLVASQKAVQLAPQDIEAKLHLGTVLNILGRVDEAKACFDQAITLNPEFALAHRNLGATLKHLGRLDEAEVSYKQAIALRPDYINALDCLGVLMQELGRHEEAEASYRQTIVFAPDNAVCHANLGGTLQAQGKLEEAEASYKQAIALRPGYIEVINNLGAVAQAMGKVEEAEAHFRQTIALKPDDAVVYANLGITLQTQGRLEEAEAIYRQALALKPAYAKAHSELGQMLTELGRLEEAESSLRQAIALKPDFGEAHLSLGKMLLGMSRLREAEASLSRAVVLKPDSAFAQILLGTIFQELGKLEEAEASFRKAIALNPDSLDARYYLAGMLKGLGRFEEAEASYRKSIALKSDFPAAHNNLLRCLYLQDKLSLFDDQLDCLINNDEANAVIGSLTSRYALKYGVEKPNLFCNDPLKYVSHIDLNTQYDFEEVFVKKARSILSGNTLSNRSQSLLVNGYQTSGNLFDIESSFTNKIEKAIREEIEKYRTNFKDSQEGLIKKWPTEYFLYGWLISMKSGGELRPHIHDDGWISGSTYINIPPKIKTNSGNLVVSIDGIKSASGKHMNTEQIIDVVTGSLVLFPASLMHYTIPFEAEEERIVLAFDVIRKD